jgi:hypothetical protein
MHTNRATVALSSCQRQTGRATHLAFTRPESELGPSVSPWSLDSESRLRVGGQLPEDSESDLGRNLGLLVACEACYCSF